MRALRVMTDREWKAVRSSGRISVSAGSWPPYEPGEVVFLFLESVPEHWLTSIAEERLSWGADEVHLVAILFEGDSALELPKDRSAAGVEGTVVHHGDIVLGAGVTIDHLGEYNRSEARWCSPGGFGGVP